MYSAMAEAINVAQSDDSLRAVIIQGDENCFTSGNDVADFIDVPPSGPNSPVYEFLKAICHAAKPLIAAVNGPAVGVGTTMLLHCDLVYVAEDAKLRMPFVNLGLCPEAGSSFLLPRLLGHLRAAELLLLGETISGQRAAEMGLANHALPKGAAVHQAARNAALRIAELPPNSVRLSKALLKQGLSLTTEEVMDREGEYFGQLLKGPEAKEALTAFMQKRKPVFT
jgi:enoyl-CoA hydratase/carnithine racemase